MFHLYLHACSMHVSCNMHGFGTFSMHAACMLHACNNLVLDSAFSNCSSFELHVYVCRQGWGQHNLWRREGQNKSLCDIFSIVFLTFTSKSCFLHVTYMLHACYLPVAPVTCTVHVTLTLTCIQHAFCQYCNMHVASTCITHDYNTHVTCMFMHVTYAGFHIGLFSLYNG